MSHLHRCLPSVRRATLVSTSEELCRRDRRPALWRRDMVRSRPPLLASLTGGATLVLFAACSEAPMSKAPTAPPEAAGAKAPVVSAPQQSVIATGLLFPRGITFDNKGVMYVAEAGTIQGNTVSTAGLCTQVAPPVGPRLGGTTSRISRIENGTRTTVASGLPST